MTKRYLEEIDRFVAISDDGQEFIVIELQTVTETSDLSGQMRTARGTKQLQLSDGSSVNYIDDETFKIVQRDEIIRRVR